MIKKGVFVVPACISLASMFGVAAALADEVADLEAVDQERFRQAIDAMRTEFVAAAASGNWESAASILSPDAIIVVPGGDDWSAIRDASELPYPPGTEMRIAPIEVRQLSPDWGYELGTTTLTWTPEGASEPQTLSDTYLVLFRKTEDGWRLFREVASSRLVVPMIPPPPVNDA